VAILRKLLKRIRVKQCKNNAEFMDPHFQTVAFQGPSVLEEVTATLITCLTSIALSQIHNLNLSFLCFLFRQLMWISG
jgi:hypothetical protein